MTAAQQQRASAKAFSLVELLVSMSILTVIMFFISVMIGEVETGWSRIRQRTVEFRDARIAFETITNRLSQARIDTYWDYEFEQGIPTQYSKASHLHFVCANASELVPEEFVQGTGHAVFFEAPFGLTRDPNLRGLSSLFNGWGYFSGFGGDKHLQPQFVQQRNLIPERHRFRLFEYQLPAEQLKLHSDTADGISRYEWITDQIDRKTVNVIAENVVAFVIQPVATTEIDRAHELAEQYRFDSRAFELSPTDTNTAIAKHEIPPIIKLTMVVAAEADFLRFLKNDEIPEEFNFNTIAPFTDSIDYEKDMESLKSHLEENRIEYRVFSTAIALRSAKWNSQ